MDWAEEFLTDCLSGIPQSKYRARLHNELEEHIKLLVNDLETAERTPEEAQAEALRQMGDADELNAGYRAAWLRQPERLRWDLSRMLFGCLQAGISTMVIFPFFAELWSKWDMPLHHPPEWLFGVVMFLIAALPNAVFLHVAFRGRADRRRLLICGLLLTWLLGHGLMLLLIAVVFQQSPLQLPPGASDGYHKGTVWWYTWQFLVGSAVGNAALGWLFTLKKEGLL